MLNHIVSWIPVRPHLPLTLCQFLNGFDVCVWIDCLTSGHHIHQNHSINVPKDLSGRRNCLELLFSWWLRMMPLHWLPFHLYLIRVSPGFVTCDDPGQKGLPLSIKIQNKAFLWHLCSVVRLRGTHLAHTFEYPKASVIASALPLLTESCTANCRLVMRQSTWIMSSARCNMHTCIRPQSIIQLRFSTSWSLNCLNPASDSAPINCTTSIAQHTTICKCSPHFLSPPLRIQLQLIVCNMCQTQTPFS